MFIVVSECSLLCPSVHCCVMEAMRELFVVRGTGLPCVCLAVAVPLSVGTTCELLTVTFPVYNCVCFSDYVQTVVVDCSCSVLPETTRQLLIVISFSLCLYFSVLCFR